MGRARENSLDDHIGLLKLGQREVVSLALRRIKQPLFGNNVRLYLIP